MKHGMSISGTVLMLALLAGPVLAQPTADAEPGIERPDRGDRVERRLDRQGDAVDHRLDRASRRAAANDRERAARRLDRRGDVVDRHLDRRGDRADRRIDRRTDLRNWLPADRPTGRQQD